MARLDAIELSRTLKDRLVDFSVSTNFLRNEKLEAVCRAIWDGPPSSGGLCSDLWVESAIPPRSSDHTLASLAQEGVLDPWLTKHLDKTGIFPADRPLYEHQAASIRACQDVDGERPAVILTAGTGSGKTESFLLPVLSALSQKKRVPHTGCRAVILYPMNALVNDQVDRLYGWLKGQSKLTLAHFTGETPEDHGLAEREQYPTFEDCRHRTRRRARGLETAEGKKIAPQDRTDPPDILITNYSMLEYMLCRPQDQVFFGTGLQAVVLDEAHLYTGTLAAEITLLLRRLYDKCGLKPKDVLQFATSATLGRGSEDELADFASTLLSRPKDRVRVIQGVKAESSFPVSESPDSPLDMAKLKDGAFHQRTIVQRANGREELLTSEEACDALEPLLAQFVSSDRVQKQRKECAEQPAQLLMALNCSPALQSVDQALREKAQISLDDLALKVWGKLDGDTVRATTELLGLASAARETLQATPILPHRLHLMLRPADGLHVCLNPECTGPSDRQYQGLGTLLAERPEKCPHCESRCLAIYRCASCGEECLAANGDNGYLYPPQPFEEPKYLFCCDPDSEVTLDPVKGCYAPGPVGVRAITECDNCGADSMKSIFSANSLVLSILAETLLTSLPPLPTVDERSNSILPARGRRLLAFSDSRAEAARLGPRLRRQHDLQMIRAAIVRLFDAQPSTSPEDIEALDSEILDLKEKLADPNSASGAKRRWEKQLRESEKDRQAMTVGGVVEDWAHRLQEDEADVLSEVLSEELGERHQADDWTQGVWTQNAEAVTSKAEEFLGNEMARLRRRHFITVETIGAVEVTYPGLSAAQKPSSFLGGLSSAKVRENLQSVWQDLLATACDLLRNGGAVTLGDRQKDLEWQQEHVPIGQWITLLQFRGKTSRNLHRKFARAVLRCAGAEEDEEALDTVAEELLTALYNSLVEMATDTAFPAAAQDKLPWLRRDLRVFGDDSAEGLQLIFPSLALRKPRQHYLCSKTGHVWPRSILGCAPEEGSWGTLYAVSEEELDRSPFVGRARREYRAESPVFKLGLWAEEHSAQLSTKETRRLQELFQKGMRNVLSATTTLELGIDIGGLSGAFLSNVPPGKANYLQRAGRVGRRADGSSVVVTCARSRPYDRQVFHRIGDFLAQPLRQPRVFLDRDRIVRRHFHSWLMGQFFAQLYAPESQAGAMEAFGNMGRFCAVALPDRWTSDLPRKPKMPKPEPPLKGKMLTPSWWSAKPRNDGLVSQYKAWVVHAEQNNTDDQLDVLFRGTAFEERSARTSLFTEAESRFSASLKDWQRDYDALLKTWEATTEQNQANAIRYQLSTLYRLTVIETLSDSRYLPRYGFPIGVHKLRVVVPVPEHERGKSKKSTRQEDQFRLERSSLLALREYVPGSQLLVGGKLITSHGLLKHRTGANVDNAFGLRGGATTCKNDHFYYWVSDKPERCPVCDEKAGRLVQNLLFPAHGFATAPWDPPKRSVDIDRVGQVIAATSAFATKDKAQQAHTLEIEDFAGVPKLKATYKEEGEMMVFNRGTNKEGFAICTACGYAESEPEKKKALPKSFMEHKPLHADHISRPCRVINENPVTLRQQDLAARELTDILLIDPSNCLGGKFDGSHALQAVTSLSVALKIAGARLLQLDSRELGSMVVPAGHDGRSFGAVIYDTVPGGAGHALELMQMERDWLTATRDLLHGGEDHHRLCERACLDCLMTFDAQALFEHTGVKLDRREALKMLDELLNAPKDSVKDQPETTTDNPTDLPALDLALGTSAPLTPAQVADWIAKLADGRFALRLPNDAVDKVASAGQWCEFRQLAKDEEPAANAIVLATHSSIKDSDLGQMTIRRLKVQDLTDADGLRPKRILNLSPQCKDRKRYDGFKIELRGEDCENWRPLAVLERSES